MGNELRIIGAYFVMGYGNDHWVPKVPQLSISNSSRHDCPLVGWACAAPLWEEHILGVHHKAGTRRHLWSFLSHLSRNFWDGHGYCGRLEQINYCLDRAWKWSYISTNHICCLSFSCIINVVHNSWISHYICGWPLKNKGKPATSGGLWLSWH